MCFFHREMDVQFCFLCSVCTRFENVTERVSRLPDTTAELVESIEYVRLSQTESLLQMRHEVNLARKRLLMLLDYTILPSKRKSYFCLVI